MTSEASEPQKTANKYISCQLGFSLTLSTRAIACLFVCVCSVERPIQLSLLSSPLVDMHGKRRKHRGARSKGGGDSGEDGCSKVGVQLGQSILELWCAHFPLESQRSVLHHHCPYPRQRYLTVVGLTIPTVSKRELGCWT